MTRVTLVAFAMSLGCAQVAEEPAAVVADAAPETAVDAGRTLAAPAERTWALVTRKDDRFTLLIEVYPVAEATCGPSVSVDPGELLAMGVQRWDGKAGTFPLGVDTPSGRGVLRYGVGDGETKGTITIEPFVDKPRYVTYETLTVGGGTLDLSRCGDLDELK